MRRRQYLGTAAAVATVGTAGCLGNGPTFDTRLIVPDSREPVLDVELDGSSNRFLILEAQVHLSLTLRDDIEAAEVTVYSDDDFHEKDGIIEDGEPFDFEVAPGVHDIVGQAADYGPFAYTLLVQQEEGNAE